MTQTNPKTLRLLPHQHALVADKTTKIIGLVAGFGSGKTFAIARKAVLLAQASPGCDGIITEPNFPLLEQILIPEMKQALEYFGIPFTYISGKTTFHCIIDGQETRIICRSAENWEKLIGINAAWVIMDEFDVSKSDVAMAAYRKLLGRIRVGNQRQMVVASTPEGFKAMYRIFVEEMNANKKLIHAKSTDNYHLPPDYIDDMRAEYPAELIDAYINGEFTNLTAGTVYKDFDRSLNGTLQEDNEKLPIHIGMDFNVGIMSAIACLVADNKVYAVAEHLDIQDTPDMVEVLRESYRNRQIFVYPDASGQSRKSIDANGSDIKLLKSAGFKVVVDANNPRIKDRVNAMSKMICNAKQERRFYVNVANCPKLTSAIEKQAWDEATGLPDKKAGHDNKGIDAVGYLITKLFPVRVERAKTRNLIPTGTNQQRWSAHG